MSKGRLCRSGLAAAVLLATAGAARADFSTFLWESQWVPESMLWVRPEFVGHLSSANYDSQNVAYTPTGNPSLFRGDVGVLVRYSPLDRFSLFGRGHWTSMFLTLNGSSASAFGLGDQTLGVNYRFLHNSRLKLDAQVQGDFPMYSNAANASAGLPFLGNAVIDITAGAFLEWATTELEPSEWFIKMGTGYTWRSNGYSAGLPWLVGISYRPQRRPLAVDLMWMGYVSLAPVSFPAQNVTACVTSPTLGTGGLCWAGSPSPSFGRPQLQLAYAFTPSVAARLFGSATVYGSSSPRDVQLGAGLQWTLLSKVDAEAEVLEQALERQRERERFPEPEKKAIGGVVTYTLEGKVIRANDRMHLVQINVGSEKGLKVGDTVDIFSVNRDGSPRETVARGRIVSVKLSEAAVRVNEYFKEVWIESGFVVKKPLSESDLGRGR